ncbi:MAG: prolipoprotein diacylglyceryl transferase [Planctomycetota bacterium]|jgi:phosphatidylglycerol:prolipoprotein diacylglycerol transferase
MKQFLNWSHIPEHINPTIFSIGPVPVRWYGILYLAGFLIVYLLVVYKIKSENLQYKTETISDLIIWAILGSLIGSRLGYVLFYDFKYFFYNPLKIFLPFGGSSGLDYTGMSGLSYHGGVIGILLTFILFCYKHRINFWHLGDLIISIIPLGFTLGRLGNFINGELYGRVTTSSWGMYFPLDPTNQLRHPSQLYEAFFEGLLLFVILWYLRKIKCFDGFIISMYFIGYGIVRFFIEFVREPDVQLGFILGYFTMGQILCLCMILSGFVIMLVKKPRYNRTNLGFKDT